MKPTLVLMPGLDGTGRLFGPFISAVNGQLATRVTAYPSDRICSYDQLLERCDRQLEELEEMVLIAESFSGPLALRFAQLHVARVKGVVLSTSFVLPPMAGWLRWLVNPLVFGIPLPDFALRRLLLGRGCSRAMVREVKEAIASVETRILAARIQEVLSVDARDALRHCPAPVLYLAASNDALVRGRSVQSVRSVRPDVEVKAVAGPHLLLQASAEEAWREIRAFLSKFEIA